ncbi:MAG: hypothetical protein ACJ76S_12440 [Solirubrobacteraceae bacterium]
MPTDSTGSEGAVADVLQASRHDRDTGPRVGARARRSGVVVDDLRRASADGVCEISARVRRHGAEERRLWWRFPQEFAPAAPDGSPFLAGVLMWAMRHGDDVTVDGPVSPRLLANVDTVIAIFNSLFPAERRRVAVSAESGSPPPPSELTGCYFTRGADSWYAVLSALEDDPQTPGLTHLVFSPDFVSSLNSPELIREKTEATRLAAQRTGMAFVEVATNLKHDFGGAQLVSTALALGFRRMLVPSGAMHGEIVRATTHPVLDHRFSTERTEIVHYGDAARVDKVARIARSQDALDTLRVCHYDGVRDDNCGRCEKCVRTMLELHVVGALDRASTLPRSLDPTVVADVRRKLGRRHQWVHVLHLLRDTPRDRELAAAIRLVLARNDLDRAAELLRETATDRGLRALHPRLPGAVRRAGASARLAGWALDAPPPGRIRALPQRMVEGARESALAQRLRARMARRTRH